MNCDSIRMISRVKYFGVGGRLELTLHKKNTGETVSMEITGSVKDLPVIGTQLALTKENQPTPCPSPTGRASQAVV